MRHTAKLPLYPEAHAQLLGSKWSLRSRFQEDPSLSFGHLKGLVGELGGSGEGTSLQALKILAYM
jgi:hypothetical protein